MPYIYVNPQTGGSDGSDYVLPTASATTKGGVKIGEGLTMTGEVLSADAQPVDVMTGASQNEAGTAGTVPAPEVGDQEKYLQGDGTWDTPAARHGTGRSAVVEGDSRNTATGMYAHAEGETCDATGRGSHSEGIGTTASSFASHAEGWGTISTNAGTHAEGHTTIASNAAAHAEGKGTAAGGEAAHAEGVNTSASGDASRSAGAYTMANKYAQSTFGTYNIAESASSVSSTIPYTEFSISNEVTIDDGETTISYVQTWSEETIQVYGEDASFTEYHMSFSVPGAKSTDLIRIDSITPGFDDSTILRSSNNQMELTATKDYSYPFTITGKLYHTGKDGGAVNIPANATSVSLSGGGFKGEYVEIVGNGTDENNRSNARTLDWSGNETIAGQMTATQFNGSGAGLTNIPASSLPTASDSALGAVKIGLGLSIDSTTGVLSADVQSVDVMTGATSSTDGTSGLVPAPETTDRAHVLTGEGIWDSLALHSNSGPTGKSVTLVVGMTDVSTINLGTDSSAILAATSSANGLMTAADKAKLDAFGNASTYALKSDITSMYKHKGSVATANDLPSTNNTEGDVYNVAETGMNYVWVEDNGTGSWDALGSIMSVTSITNAEIDTILAS